MEYPKSDGAMWPNAEKAPDNNKPDHRGRILVTNDQIRMLIAQSKAGLEPTIQVGAWHRTAKESGNPYIFMSTETYMKDDSQQGQQQQKTPYQPPQQQQAPPQQQQGGGFEDDDLPF